MTNSCFLRMIYNKGKDHMEVRNVIYTVTLNPSLDYIVTVQDFAIGKTNRTLTEEMLPGGKGINVSIMLQNLGFHSIAMGFTAGFSGAEIERKSKALGFESEFIRVEEGFSRINIKMKDFEGTEINGQGPVINEAHAHKLSERLDTLQSGDILVLAGSVPKGMTKNTYRDMVEQVVGKGILCVVDATGEVLLETLPYGPFLIKPNNHELGELFGVEVKTRKEAVPYAKKLQEMGARNVLISFAGDGAVFVAEDGEAYLADAPDGRLVNGVGAGDSMVAGFLAGWLEAADLSAAEGNGILGQAKAGQQYRHAFRMAVSAGSASAFSRGFATKEDVRKLYDTAFSVEKI